MLSTLQELRQTFETEGKVTFDQWNPHIQRPEFLASALNLAEYLALRRHDLRQLLHPAPKYINTPELELNLPQLTFAQLKQKYGVAY